MARPMGSLNTSTNRVARIHVVDLGAQGKINSNVENEINRKLLEVGRNFIKLYFHCNQAIIHYYE